MFTLSVSHILINHTLLFMCVERWLSRRYQTSRITTEMMDKRGSRYGQVSVKGTSTNVRNLLCKIPNINMKKTSVLLACICTRNNDLIT